MKATTEKQKLMITFDGDSHQIDANTLITVLTHYNSIINIANKEYGNGNRNVHLRVEALQKGSFDIVMLLDEGLKTLFSKDTAEYLADLAAIIGAVFAAYKFMRGKPVKSESEQNIVKNIIKGKKNILNTIINIYNTPIVREAASKSFEKANEDPNVEGLTISSDNGDSVSFPKKDFPYLIYKDFDKENLPQERAIFVDAYLTITALNFVPGGNWKFLYNGFSISMTVKDDALMKAIDNGARFGKGDTLHVKLKICQRYDNEMKGFVNTSYRIEEFYKHILAPSQTELFEE